MDPLWIMISIPFTALLVVAGMNQFKKYKKASEETHAEEKDLNEDDK
ncbi:MAG: hypothetical protein JJU16_00885 [Alkalibacterium sp.]|nr:hypothetical protein [Alkalibacterium sp.]